MHGEKGAGFKAEFAIPAQEIGAFAHRPDDIPAPRRGRAGRRAANIHPGPVQRRAHKIVHGGIHQGEVARCAAL